jgi:hypothetical protein
MAATTPKQTTTVVDRNRVTALANTVSSGVRTLITADISWWSS